MKVIVVKNPESGAKEAFNIFKNELENGAKVFGLATGSTPITTYEKIVDSDLDFSNAVSVNLDEYVGLAPTDEQSYNYFMHKHLFDAKPFKESNLPNGLAEDADAEAKRYDKVIEDNPIDLQILGIGQNGHIGFNEPGTPAELLTHKVKLTDSTVKANARFFEDEKDVPRYAYSMGIASILKAKHIILEAFGESKADAVKAMIEGPVTEDLPASFLQNHDNVTIIIDEEAASKLSK